MQVLSSVEFGMKTKKAELCRGYSSHLAEARIGPRELSGTDSNI